jgi:hypothetical protein
VASFAVVALLWAGTVQADGSSSYYDPVREQWRLLEEPAQYAAIAVRDGYETLLLKVDVQNSTTPEEARQLAWITPIPAEASAVTVDILRGFPRFSGREPGKHLASIALVSLAAMSATQIYPVPLLALALVRGGAAPTRSPEVTVHKTVQRDGVELQLVTAASIGALDRHLRELGVAFPGEGLDSLESYAGDDACFVLFRIVDLVTYRKAIRESRFPLGIEARFPADEGFFPLTASSAVPVALLDVSVVAPEFVTATGPLPSGMTTRHLVGRVSAGPEATAALGIAPSPSTEQRYTEFQLLAPPGQLTSDLRFRPGAPMLTRWAASWVLSPLFGWLGWIVGLLSFAGLSIVSAQVAHVVWPKQARPSRRVVAAIGMANFLTVVGVLVAALVVARRSRISPWRALRFTVLTSLTFCVLVAALAGVVLIAHGAV